MSLAVRPRRQIVVDMTPLDAGGQNGGAGLVATNLVRHLARLTPAIDFTLLTCEASHAELASLDAANVRRTCVVSRRGSPSFIGRAADHMLPPRLRARLRHVYWLVRTARHYRGTTDDKPPDLLFCPFTVPYFWRPGVPCVCIVHDLQHLAYPQFFTSEQRLNRQQQFGDAAQKADRLVCVSEYVRRTVLANLKVDSRRVKTIPHGLLSVAEPPDCRILKKFGLETADFLLYPSNFWPHKNHRKLFEALRSVREQRADWPLQLVCTGAPNAAMDALRTVAESLLPPGTILFAGYVRSDELVALLEASKALVFPSLYEGFGMPVLEAMALGKPVLSSNVTSLPEVAGDAATYFDPTSALEIASAIEALHDRPSVVAERVTLGRQRAAVFGDAQAMAGRYLDLFSQLVPGIST